MERKKLTHKSVTPGGEPLCNAPGSPYVTVHIIDVTCQQCRDQYFRLGAMPTNEPTHYLRGLTGLPACESTAWKSAASDPQVVTCVVCKAWMSQHSGDTKTTFSSGAQSSEQKPWYHLVPFDVFMARLAERYRHGVQDKGYVEDNWRKGLNERAFILDRANHTIEHLHKAVEKIRLGNFSTLPDDDLAAVLWGTIFLMAAQDANKPEAAK